MPVRYVNAQLGNPLDPMEPKKFYLVEKSIGNVDRNYPIRDMVRNTSLTPMEAATGIRVNALKKTAKASPLMLQLL